MNKKIIVICLSLLTSNISLTKDTFAGEVMGRELNAYGLEWTGHVGLATNETRKEWMIVKFMTLIFLSS